MGKLRKNQPGYTQSKDKNGKTIWVPESTSATHSGSLSSRNAVEDFSPEQDADVNSVVSGLRKKASDFHTPISDVKNIAVETLDALEESNSNLKNFLDKHNPSSKGAQGGDSFRPPRSVSDAVENITWDLLELQDKKNMKTDFSGVVENLKKKVSDFHTPSSEVRNIAVESLNALENANENLHQAVNREYQYDTKAPVGLSDCVENSMWDLMELQD